jgi:hypothetical protein
MTGDPDTAVAVNPATGELLEHLDTQPPATLAEALAAIRIEQAKLTDWARALEAQLRHQLKVQERTVAQFGDYQVTAKPSNRSTWDVELFENELGRLVEQGAIKASEVTEVIKRETTVRAGEANRLIARLDGEPKAALSAARSWREEPGKVTVEKHTAELPAPEQVSSEPRPSAPPAHPQPDASVPPARPAQAPTQQPAPAPALDPEELFA